MGCLNELMTMVKRLMWILILFRCESRGFMLVRCWSFGQRVPAMRLKAHSAYGNQPRALN